MQEAGAVSDQAEPLVRAKKLYTTKCARCHKFYDPQRYTDEQWAMWMDKMRRKARLTQEQFALLSAYLEQVRDE